MRFLSWLRGPAPRPAEPEPEPDLRTLLAAHRRRAWLPVVEEGGGAPDASRFGGTPWLAPGEAWPACGNCGLPMQLLVQLHPRDLPAGEGARLGGALLQLFFCTREEPFCADDLLPDAPALVRLVAPAGEGQAPGARPRGGFPARRIVGWEAADDLPQAQELEPELGSDELDALLDLTFALPGGGRGGWRDALGRSGFPLPGDKWGGWPNWAQEVDYPRCPECRRGMALLFQVASEDHVPYTFGDGGTGHVTQCPAHPERVAFGWAGS